jgi:hypothetical protein
VTEVGKRLAHVVFVEGEVLGLQVIDVLALRVLDGRGDRDEVDLGAKTLIGGKRDRQQ